jgi:hypothetical protein
MRRSEETDKLEEPNRELASRVFIGLSILFWLGSVVTGHVLAAMNDRPMGFGGDGQLAPSCLTPGGPYYPDDLAASQRRCPHLLTTPLKLPHQSDVGKPVDEGR